MANRKRGNCEGSIYKTADGRWRAAVDYGYQNGKRKRKLLSGRTRREVSAKLTRALGAHQAGLPPVPERETLDRFLDRWLEDSVKASVRYSTHASYSRLVAQHLRPALGRIPLAKLTPRHIQTMLSAKLKEGLSPRTVQYLRAVLRRALGQALKWGVVARNAAALTDPPKVPRYEVHPLTAEQARQFLAALEGDRLEALYVVALSLGLRQGELLGLAWDDLDLEKGILTVRHSLQRIEGRLQLVEPKTRRSRRTLPLPAVTLDALRLHRERQQRDRILAGNRWREHGLVFASTIGTPLDGMNITHHFQRTLALLGLPRQRFHDMRHACASFLLTEGVHARAVMEILGHSQISLTMDTYAHVAQPVLGDAMGRMDAVLSPVAARMAATPVSGKVN